MTSADERMTNFYALRTFLLALAITGLLLGWAAVTDNAPRIVETTSVEVAR